MRSRALGLLAGALLDAVFADPARWHPVAGFGSAAAALERRTYTDRRAAGVVHVGVLVGAALGLGTAAETSRRRPVRHAALTAAATWAVLGGTSLARHGEALATECGSAARARKSLSWQRFARTSGGAASPDLVAARARIPSLCGRDPASLDLAGIVRAGVESLAENTSDAVVAPLFWGAVAGVPGLLGYRAVNTLDAMIGRRSTRYARFGWAAARLDDVVNLVPARVAALLFAAAAPAVGGSPRAAVAAWRRDARAHPSPNAGPVEAAAAGALGVTLGGRTVYAHGVEERPRLGSGPPPTPADLRRAARLSRLVSAGATALAVAWTARPR